MGIVDIYSKYIGLQYLKMAVNEYDVGLIQRNLKLSWTGDYESLKYLVKNYLNLAGDWVSPGGEKKTFHGDNITISCLKNKKLIQVEGSNATAIIQKLLSFFNGESTDNSEVQKSQSNNVQVGACSNCNDLQSAEAIKSLNEVVQLVADVLCISTVVSRWRTCVLEKFLFWE